MNSAGSSNETNGGPAPTVFRTQRLVEFSDTDQAGIAHFSRFYVFMENAEHEFLRSIGSSVHLERDGRVLGWPRLEARCRFFRPVRFEELVRPGNRGIKPPEHRFARLQ